MKPFLVPKSFVPSPVYTNEHMRAYEYCPYDGEGVN